MLCVWSVCGIGELVGMILRWLCVRDGCGGCGLDGLFFWMWICCGFLLCGMVLC